MMSETPISIKAIVLLSAFRLAAAPALPAVAVVPTAGAAEGVGVEKPFYRAELIFQPSLEFPRCHSSNITALADGTLVAAWWHGSQEGAGDLVIRSSRRPAGKLEWTPPRTAGDSPGLTEGNPVFVHPPGGELWLLYRSGLPWVKIMRTVSRDLGATWSEPEVFWGEPGWTLRSRSINLSNGDILIPAMTEEASVFIYSDDGGATWKRAAPIATEPRNNEPAVAERPDGSLLAFLRPFDPDPAERFLWRSESFDRGRTWTAAERTRIPNPSSAMELLRLASGRIALAFNDSHENRTPLCLALSEDGGRSWSYKRVLEDAPGRFSYPSMCQTDDGRIHLTYTFRRQSIKHVEVNEAWVMEQGWNAGPGG